jgi:hypothetical protein
MVVAGLWPLPCGSKAEFGESPTGKAAGDGSADKLRTKGEVRFPSSRRGRFLKFESASSIESLRLLGGSRETARVELLAALSPGAAAITSSTWGADGEEQRGE